MQQSTLGPENITYLIPESTPSVSAIEINAVRVLCIYIWLFQTILHHRVHLNSACGFACGNLAGTLREPSISMCIYIYVLAYLSREHRENMCAWVNARNACLTLRDACGKLAGTFRGTTTDVQTRRHTDPQKHKRTDIQTYPSSGALAYTSR